MEEQKDEAPNTPIFMGVADMDANTLLELTDEDIETLQLWKDPNVKAAFEKEWYWKERIKKYFPKYNKNKDPMESWKGVYMRLVHDSQLYSLTFAHSDSVDYSMIIKYKAGPGLSTNKINMNILIQIILNDSHREFCDYFFNYWGDFLMELGYNDSEYFKDPDLFWSIFHHGTYEKDEVFSKLRVVFHKDLKLLDKLFKGAIKQFYKETTHDLELSIRKIGWVIDFTH